MTTTGLVRATHPGPTVVVTTVAVLLAVAVDVGAGATTLLALAVLTGQLTVGWSNDLLDAGRDRAVGRTDKPLVTGEVSARTTAVALVLAVVTCAAFSLALGPWPALVHLGFLLCAWSYNLGLKSTPWSPLPYALAFGTLPALVWLVGTPPALAPWWALACGALLGVGAHLVNVLPDLADDAATGVRGLPHRLGARASGVLAGVVLLAGSVVVVLGPPAPVPVWAWGALALAAVLAAACATRPGRLPFYAAMSVALLDVVVLVGRAG